MSQFLNLKDGIIATNSYRFPEAKVTTQDDLYCAYREKTGECLTAIAESGIKCPVSGSHDIDSQLSENSFTDVEKLIKKIESDEIDEIVKMAVEAQVGAHNGIVFYDTEDDTYSSNTWTSGTYLNPESRLIEIYRLNGNWIANNNWEVNDILTDEEYEELRDAVRKKEQPDSEDDLDYMVDFTDADQLKLIDVDLNERLAEYLLYDGTLKNRIIENLQSEY